MLQFICLLFAVHLSPPDDWHTYNDSLNRFSIQYPASWAQTIYGGAAAFLSPVESDTDKFQENVNVMLQDLSAQPMTLKEFTDLSKKEYSDPSGTSSIISVKDTSLCGLPAEVGLFYMQYMGQALKLKQIWFIKKNTAYVLTYTADPRQFDKYLSTVTHIMGSFKLGEK